MTITTNDTRDEYTATGGQTTFNYTFKIFADTDLLVYQTASGATPDDTTDLITAYTVTGVGNANGGTIVLDTGATLNDKITIVSNISYERDTDYQFNGDYTADVVNDEQDKQLSLIKQVKEEISRTMQFPRAAQSATGKVLPQPSDLADCVLAFDSNGDPAAGPSATSMQALIDAAEAVIADSNAGAVSATKVGASTFWTFTDVQGFIDQLLTGDPKFRGTLQLDTDDSGSPAEYGKQGIVLSKNLSTRTHLIDPYTIGCIHSEAGGAQGEDYVMYMFGGTFYLSHDASTSGFGTVFSIDRDDGGYFAVLSSTGTQSKVLEYDTVSVNPTKALKLPSYANLAAINAAISSPAAGMMVYVTGQGVAVYKASWVRATDETTAIT